MSGLLKVALDSTSLPGELRADPADRFLIAEAPAWGLAWIASDRAEDHE